MRLACAFWLHLPWKCCPIATGLRLCSGGGQPHETCQPFFFSMQQQQAAAISWQATIASTHSPHLLTIQLRPRPLKPSAQLAGCTSAIHASSRPACTSDFSPTLLAFSFHWDLWVVCHREARFLSLECLPGQQNSSTCSTC